jgi:aralkylamine N-acetyltransferase
MISIVFLTDPTSEQIEQITSLYRGAGWWPEKESDPELVHKIVTGSHCFITATSNRRIIGMGRAISDRVSDAYIQDVTVAAESRGMGVGSRIIEALLQKLNSDGLAWIGVVAENNTHLLYEKIGFKTMANAKALLKIKL